MNVQGIEDIYSMTPLQQGLLFHSLLAPRSGLYVDQFVFDLPGKLDVDALKNAWQQVIDRHAILRTSFHWENLSKPIQVVYKNVDFSLEVRDWRGASPAKQEQSLESLLNEDRQTGFDLSAPPLMRQILIRISDDSYRFVWSFHHLILDGWSSSIVKAELFALYEAFSRGERLQLEQVAPFSDYIAWLRRQDLGAAETFWREKLAGLKQRNSLVPVRRPYGAPDSEIQRTHQELQFSSQLTADLRSSSRRHRVTLNTISLAAWALLVSRYLGEREVVVGVTVSGRPESIPQVETMVGNFINTLPARIQVPTNDLLSWLQQLQRELLELRSYQYTPLVDIQRWSELPAVKSLFDSIFVFEDSLSGDATSALQLDNARHLFKTNYPLTVQISPAENLIVRIEYDARAFTADAIEMMLKQYEHLLSSFTDLTLSLANVTLMSAPETLKQWREWNDTRSDYPRSATLHELFALQTQKTPDSVAIESDDGRLTYQELDAQANALASKLQSLGVGPEVKVGLLMERSIDLVLAALATLKAGGVCVPLDPVYPKERLKLMISEADARVVLARAEVSEDLLEGFLHEEFLGFVCAFTPVREKNFLPHTADNLAYIIYTSGSTGVPKGAEITHRGIVRLLTAQNYIDLNGSETFLHLSPPSFDASFFEVWGALLHGGKCVVLPDNRFSPFELGATIEKHSVNVLWLTSSLFNSVVNENVDALSGVRQLLVGGETLSVAHVSKALRNLPHTQLINGYGPTENTTFSCCYAIPQAFDSLRTSVPIGRPIANTEVYVLDEQLNAQPVGVVGELYLGGDGLARGYLNDAALTAEKFVPNPYSQTAGARMYRSGDRGRYLAGGELEFLGRSDEQVKVRGYRIELREVELAIEQHAAVRRAVACKQQLESGEQRLFAYFVRAEEAALSTGELRRFLTQRLPEYAIPSGLIELESLPLTASGKVDRLALAARAVPMIEAAAEHVAPRTMVEELLCEIWAGVLGLEKVGVHDDFLELGGDSLLAIRLLARIREAFKIEFDLKKLFECQTIDSLAVEIEARLHNRADSPPPLTRSSSPAEAPLSLAQQRLWILDQLEPGSPAHNVVIAAKVLGQLNTAALHDSFNEVVRRHELLRSNILVKDSLPVQVITPPPRLNIPCTDLREVVEAERESTAMLLARDEGLLPFDLAKDFLLRVRLFRLQDQEHILVVTTHHIVSDGRSLEILVDEVATLYDHYANGALLDLPEPSIQYSDYSVWQRDWLQGERLDQQLAYWTTQLANAPAELALPFDRRRPALQTANGARQTIDVPAPVHQAVRKLAREERVTLFMALLAVFKSLLHRYTGETDLLVGTVVANRSQIETEPLIGFFVNNLVLRTDLSGDLNFRELLTRVRAVLLAAYAHQDVPFEKLVEELQPERNLSTPPLFQVYFTFQAAPASVLEIPGLSLRFLELDTGTAKFDLSLAMIEGEESLSAVLEYNTDLFDAATISRMLDHFVRLLEGVTADPELPISRQPLLSQEEEKLLTVDWNKTQLDCRRDLCLHQFFEQQAERTPDAIALVCCDERLTYDALNVRANKLARYLRNAGVEREEVVGICMSRSTEMVVAMLATLKTGAAYLPLDPGYPKERLALMLNDVGARVLLTEEHLADKLPEHEARLILLTGSGSEYANEDGRQLPPCAEPDNLAYLIYTSGSTGRPKGVAIEHRNAVTLMHWARRTYSAEELSAVLATTSICFDLSIFEIFAPLSHGGKIILVENALELLTPGPAEDATLINTVPSAIAEVLKVRELPQKARTINLAGESIPNALITQVYEHPNVERVFNLYGPSEDTTYSTVALVQRDDERPPAIGHPLSNKQIYLLDRHMRLVPRGVAGEVYIGGEGLSRGYYAQPDATAEKFLPNPFSDIPGARLYRTGDLARYRSDGELEFLGRADQQIKLRGFRIELGEIEAALGRHEAIREAIVLVRQEAAQKALIAYVVPKPETSLQAGELQNYLRAKLPDYMVPGRFVVLESLPRLPNGKTDRNALAALDHLRTAELSPVVSPRDELETAIVQIWSEVLGAGKIGIHDNFFTDLGGHSLLAIQTVTKLRERFDSDMSFITMFQFPTVSTLAEHLRAGGNWQPSEQVAEQAQRRSEVLRERRLFKQARRAQIAN